MNTKQTIVVIASYEENKFFFSTDHCQNHGLGETYVPCTHNLPSSVVPREGLESGIIRTKQDLITVFYSDMEEIENPDKTKQD